MEEKRAELQSLYNRTLILSVLRYSHNVGLDTFKENLAVILDNPNLVDSYVEEKFYQMRKDFVEFFCNLDSDAQDRFIAMAIARCNPNTMPLGMMN